MNSLPNFMSLKNIHIYNEYSKDPKYKTEMCKNWERKSSCPYNNKCRFAHGKEELMIKELESNPNYKAKDCLNFFKFGFCTYGRRCCFRHDERKFNEKSVIHDFMIMLKLRNPYKYIKFNEEINDVNLNNIINNNNDDLIECKKYKSYESKETTDSNSTQCTTQSKNLNTSNIHYCIKVKRLEAFSEIKFENSCNFLQSKNKKLLSLNPSSENISTKTSATSSSRNSLKQITTVSSNDNNNNNKISFIVTNNNNNNIDNKKIKTKKNKKNKNINSNFEKAKDSKEF